MEHVPTLRCNNENAVKISKINEEEVNLIYNTFVIAQTFLELPPFIST